MIWTILALAGVCIACVLIVQWPSIKAAMDEGKVVAKCGYLSPPPTDAAHGKMLRVCRFFIRNFVGKLEVTGAEKLATAPGPFLVAFNHGNMLDVAIAPVVVNRKARFPAAQGVMKAAGGLLGFLFSKWGAFSVDLDNGHAAFDASVKVLTANDDANIEVIFPEAWTNMDGEVKKFKTGTVRMAVEAAERLGHEVFVYPGYMHYGRYLPSYMTKWPIPVQWLMPLLFPIYFKRGCKVVIGEGISSNTLKGDPRVATALLRERVLALKPAE